MTRSTSTGLLVAGYVLAVPFTLWTPGFLRLWRRREPWVFAAEQVGAALITAGFIGRDDRRGALINGSWAIGLTAAYLAEGRKRSRVAQTSARGRLAP